MANIIIQPRERWKVITYPNITKDMYYVSNYGNVKDMNNNQIKIYYPKDERPIVNLMRIDGMILPIRIYRLVAHEFVYNDDPINKTTVNHKDLNKRNSFYQNLEWATYKENNDHAMLNGVGKQFQKGSNHPNSIYTDDMIKFICEQIEKGRSSRDTYLNMIELFDQFNVSYTNFSKQFHKIKHGQRWTHISQNYNILKN